MVLSAGFGTRLRPLTDEIPKPLVTVGDRALLLTTLEKLHEQGAARLCVNVHHVADKIESKLKQLKFTVDVFVEEEIRGTAGGIAQANALLSGAPAIVVNGDIVGELPLDELLEAPTDGLALAPAPGSLGEGTVGVGSDGSVVRLRGEFFGEEVLSGDYIGVAQLGERCLATLPEEGCLVGDWALPELRSGRKVQTVMTDVSFEDIGTPGAYLSANLAWLDRRLSSALGREGYVGHLAELGPGVHLNRCVIGEGAKVSGVGLIEECVVLPGAHAVAPLKHAIVTPAGVVMEVDRDEVAE